MLVVAAIALTGIAVWLVASAPKNIALERLESIQVEGYSRTEESYENNVGPAASAIYFGPPTTDIRQAITAPGLRLEVYEPPDDIEQRIQHDGPGAVETVMWGEFPDDCSLYVSRLHDPVPPYWMSRTAEQSEALRRGELVAYQFTIPCGPG
ncbi:hypothetical protein [Nocardia fluminea]|uniref:Uncharacterized protein n=1 Tax=Nocardia fluminea TaxID=134984 RepID=A0A2N3VBA5_9NOCA|nr:hypothetical protein [Nocardia fluminea]PKV78898.1 hypothetical protein ATK86_3281 [Nocardia fluminea]